MRAASHGGLETTRPGYTTERNKPNTTQLAKNIAKPKSVIHARDVINLHNIKHLNDAIRKYFQPIGEIGKFGEAIYSREERESLSASPATGQNTQPPGDEHNIVMDWNFIAAEQRQYCGATSQIVIFCRQS
jgi:hypothetical protein